MFLEVLSGRRARSISGFNYGDHDLSNTPNKNKKNFLKSLSHVGEKFGSDIENF